jgi:hypothetical protein
MARKATKTARKRTDTMKLNLRYPWWIYRRLLREALRRDCSLNSEIVERLSQSLLSGEPATSPVAAKARALRFTLDEAVLSELVTLFIVEEVVHNTGSYIDRLEEVARRLDPESSPPFHQLATSLRRIP